MILNLKVDNIIKTYLIKLKMFKNRLNFAIIPEKILLFFITILFFSCGKGFIFEKEPNDNLENAFQLEIPSKIKGEIASQKDIDFFKILCRDFYNCCLNIKFTQNSSEPVKFTIYSGKNQIKSVITKTDSNPVILNNLNFKDYLNFIKIEPVKKLKKPVSYLLIIDKEDNLGSFETEPNDNYDEATEISKDAFIKGFFSPYQNLVNSNENGLECDWYKYSVSEKSNMINIELTVVPDIDSVIEFYDEFLFLLKRIDSFGIDEPEAIKNFFIPKSGNYFIKVYAKNYKQNNKIPYKLYISSSPLKNDFEIEPNDSINFANNISNSVKGYIFPKGDIDWFTFTNSFSDAILNLTLTPVSGIDFLINIYNSSFEKYFTINFYGENFGEVFPDLYISSGRYYIEVMSLNSESFNINKYYNLSIQLKKYQSDFEIEPNNSFETSQIIELNKTIRGFISAPGDNDFYKISVKKNENLKFSVTGVNSVNLVIEIYNSERKLFYKIDENGIGGGESRIIEIPAGSYYIILKDAENHNSNYYENYNFTILER